MYTCEQNLQAARRRKAHDGRTIAPIYVRPFPVLGCFLGHLDALFEFFAPLMTQSSPSSAPAIARAQEPWSVALGSSLAPEETILAGLQLDLDARLHFTQGWLVVTNRRLIGRAPGTPNGKDLQSWDITPGMTLAHSDHAGVGALELTDGQHRLASWRYTLLRPGPGRHTSHCRRGSTALDED